MPLFVKIRNFFRNLLSSRSVDVELDQELYSYLELLTQEKIHEGLSQGSSTGSAY